MRSEEQVVIGLGVVINLRVKESGHSKLWLVFKEIKGIDHLIYK